MYTRVPGVYNSFSALAVLSEHQIPTNELFGELSPVRLSLALVTSLITVSFT
jgi:hypothetical protein